MDPTASGVSDLEALLERMVAARQLSASDARALTTHRGNGTGAAVR